MLISMAGDRIDAERSSAQLEAISLDSGGSAH
jgi:hypothetical protein